MALLPYIDGANGLVDGAYFHALPFCKRHCSGVKCQEHYEKMKCAEAGSYCWESCAFSAFYPSPNRFEADKNYYFLLKFGNYQQIVAK